jgi:hypothetical protein
MSLALILIGIVILLVGLPWLLAALGFMFWAVARCCNAVWPSRLLRPPIA